MVAGVLILLVFLSVAFVFYKWEIDPSPCIPDIPQRIGKVSKTAKWIGGCDGGHWFDIVEILPDSNKYRIVIYFDYNGELYTDEYFEAVKKCTIKCDIEYNQASKILDEILFYSGYEIEMKSECYLVPVKKLDKFEKELREQWNCK